eukprot:SAG22_NODE_2294_length_2748_cov_1.243488_4_plen_56_part_01
MHARTQAASSRQVQPCVPVGSALSNCPNAEQTVESGSHLLRSSQVPPCGPQYRCIS